MSAIAEVSVEESSVLMKSAEHRSPTKTYATPFKPSLNIEQSSISDRSQQESLDITISIDESQQERKLTI